MIATIARKSSRELLAMPVMEGLLENTRADFAAFRVVPIDEPRIVEASALALRHRLRTMDAVHLACALSLGSPSEIIMVSADLELLAAATRENLSVFNPASS
jgi:predicted nucleic acid-binding protein